MKIKIKDPVIKKVVKKFVDRSNVGFKKYNVTLRDDKSNMDAWLNHLQEELMDAVNYIERAREEIKALPYKSAIVQAAEDYQQALEDIDIVDPVTYTYTGPEKLPELKREEYDYGCTFCTCSSNSCCNRNG